MSFFTELTNRFFHAMEKRAALRVYEHLQRVDAVQLEYAGISPALLAKGPAAYPWRENVIRKPIAVAQMPVSNETAIRLAIAELKACSDAELQDLNISRGDIARAVRFGRPGIDQADVAQDRKAAA